MWSHGIRHHQKINHTARKKLARLTSVQHFPSNELLDYFEGDNGPDSMKAKGKGHKVPNQYYDPFDDDDTAILEEINNHFEHLVKHLRGGNEERSAFEASWLAHMLVDGLTPAHHHPYNEELQRLERHGSTKLKRSDIVRVSADKASEVLKSNWKIWGAKGIITSHILFEGGVAAISAPLSFNTLKVTLHDIKEAKQFGLEEYFMRLAREVAILRMYDRYNISGWSTKLARDVRDELMPRIIRIVTIAWYLALTEAGYTSRPKK